MPCAARQCEGKVKYLKQKKKKKPFPPRGATISPAQEDTYHPTQLLAVSTRRVRSEIGSSTDRAGGSGSLVHLLQLVGRRGPLYLQRLATVSRSVCSSADRGWSDRQ